MTKKFDFGAWKDEVDGAITHLAMACRPAPTRNDEEPPYQPVEDPDKLKIRAFIDKIDRQVLAFSRGEEVDLDWKVIWLRLCRDAIMNSDRERLNELLALYAVAQEAADERGI